MSAFRFNLFSELHDITFNGNGGWEYMTVYNLPIWLRKLTFNKLKQFHSPPDDDVVEKTRANIKNAQNTAPSQPITKPDYVTKGSRK